MAQAPSMDIPGSPGDLLRYARSLARKEQREVADELGIDPKTVSRWENGKSEPTISQWWKLARFLDAGWLLYPRTETEGNMTLYVPIPAGIQVRPRTVNEPSRIAETCVDAA